VAVPPSPEKDRKENGRKENEPGREETFFGSPHVPFCYFLFYPSWLLPEAGLGKLWTCSF
jgi:hypothetical protein